MTNSAEQLNNIFPIAGNLESPLKHQIECFFDALTAHKADQDADQLIKAATEVMTYLDEHSLKGYSPAKYSEFLNKTRVEIEQVIVNALEKTAELNLALAEDSYAACHDIPISVQNTLKMIYIHASGRFGEHKQAREEAGRKYSNAMGTLQKLNVFLKKSFPREPEIQLPVSERCKDPSEGPCEIDDLFCPPSIN